MLDVQRARREHEKSMQGVCSVHAGSVQRACKCVECMMCKEHAVNVRECRVRAVSVLSVKGTCKVHARNMQSAWRKHGKCMQERAVHDVQRVW